MAGQEDQRPSGNNSTTGKPITWPLYLIVIGLSISTVSAALALQSEMALRKKECREHRRFVEELSTRLDAVAARLQTLKTGPETGNQQPAEP